MSSLLPCPFDGAEWGTGLTVGYNGQPATGFHVTCIKCGCCGPHIEGQAPTAINSAIEAWNRRAALASGDEAEQLKARLKGVEAALREAEYQLVGSVTGDNWAKKHAAALQACCANEKRSMSGGCLNCGDPCL